MTAEEDRLRKETERLSCERDEAVAAMNRATGKLAAADAENRELRELVAVLAPRVGPHEFQTYPDYMEWTYERPRKLGIDV